MRNWTLREGRPNRSPNNPEVLWKRYAAYLGPGGLAKAGLPLPNQLPKISRRSPQETDDGNGTLFGGTIAETMGGEVAIEQQGELVGV